MNTHSPSRLPRRVFFALIIFTVLAAIGVFAYGLSSGWVPPRESASVVLPLYFAVFLAVLVAAFVVSGNTLMHHYRTGTVQRATDPVSFWSIVGVQSAIALALLIVGCVNFMFLYG